MNASILSDLSTALPIPPGGIASRPLMDLPGNTKLVLFALDAEQEISAHTTPFPADILGLDGHIRVQVGEEWHEVAPGTRIPMPKGLPHAVHAVQPSHFLLTMLRGL